MQPAALFNSRPFFVRVLVDACGFPLEFPPSTPVSVRAVKMTGVVEMAYLDNTRWSDMAASGLTEETQQIPNPSVRRGSSFALLLLA